MNPALWIALGGLLIALPGLLRPRLGPWPVRAGAAACLAALFAAALDLRLSWRETARPRLTVVPTSAIGQAAREELQQSLPSDTDFVEPHPDLSTRIAVEAMRRPCERIAVVWSGPFLDAGRPLRSDAVEAYQTVAPPPIDPSDLSLRVARPLQVGRPGAFEIEAQGAVGPWKGSLQILTDPPQTLPIDGSGSTTVTLRHVPKAAGVCDVRLEVKIQGRTYTGSARIEVASPPRVLIVGRRAAPLSEALSVQGLAVSVEPALPANLSGYDALIVEGPTPDAAALTTFVHDGGGLFLLGAEDGGALPMVGSPLAVLSPVLREPAAVEPAADATGEQPGDKKPSTPESKPTPPPERQPPESKPPPPPPTQPERAAGDTSGARVVEGPETLVERRTVAMVLVIDKSGSMGQKVGGAEEKIAYAKQSAYETAKSLKPGDEVAVVLFGENAVVQLPMTAVTQLDRIRDTIEGVRAADRSTLVGDALRRSKDLLRSSRAGVKHLVIISDGEIHDASEASTRIASNQLKREGATISMIRISRPGDDVMLSAAQALTSPGCFHAEFDARRIPRIVSTEVQRALTSAGRASEARALAEVPPNQPHERPLADAKPEQPKPVQPKPEPARPEPAKPEPVKPEPARPEPRTQPPETPQPDSKPRAPIRVRAVVDSPLLLPHPKSEFPPVYGVVSAHARPDAHVLLVAGEVPLLAYCNRGAGRVAAWSSDLAGADSKDWRSESAFPARLAQWVAALLPPLRSEPRELLGPVVMDPPAPARAELEALASLGSGKVKKLTELVMPAPLVVDRSRGRSPELARWIGLALLLLALLEFGALRKLAWSA